MIISNINIVKCQDTMYIILIKLLYSVMMARSMTTKFYIKN